MDELMDVWWMGRWIDGHVDGLLVGWMDECGDG